MPFEFLSNFFGQTHATCIGITLFLIPLRSRLAGQSLMGSQCPSGHLKQMLPSQSNIDFMNSPSFTTCTTESVSWHERECWEIANKVGVEFYRDQKGVVEYDDRKNV